MLSSKYIELTKRITTAATTQELFIEARITRSALTKRQIKTNELSSLETMIDIRRNWLDAKGR